MQIIGHRGAMGEPDCPENTLPSFQRALEARVDGIEFDVWRCASSELVVIHDRAVDRTTNGAGYVFQKPLYELKALTIRDITHLYWGVKVPTLTEVLNLVGNSVTVNIELKFCAPIQTSSEAEQMVVATHAEIERRIGKGWSRNNFLVSSFDHYILALLRQLDPHLRIGALFGHNPITKNNDPTTKYGFVQELRPYSVNPDLEFTDEALVQGAKRKGMKVFVWTVNRLEDLRQMIKWDVDGVFTNYPTMFRQYLDDLAKRPFS